MKKIGKFLAMMITIIMGIGTSINAYASTGMDFANAMISAETASIDSTTRGISVFLILILIAGTVIISVSILFDSKNIQ